MFRMQRRYRKIRDILPKLWHPEVKELGLTHEDEHEIDALTNRLKDLGSVTVELQTDWTYLLDAGFLLDGVLGK